MTITECMEWYLDQAKYNHYMANVYSWNRWEYYNRLRLHRAHNYLERIVAVLTGAKTLNNHNLARIGGRASCLSSDRLDIDYLDRHNAYCMSIGWDRHCVEMTNVAATYRSSVASDESPEWCQGFGKVVYAQTTHKSSQCEFAPECLDCGCVSARRV